MLLQRRLEQDLVYSLIKRRHHFCLGLYVPSWCIIPQDSKKTSSKIALLYGHEQRKREKKDAHVQVRRDVRNVYVCVYNWSTTAWLGFRLSLAPMTRTRVQDMHAQKGVYKKRASQSSAQARGEKWPREREERWVREERIEGHAAFRSFNELF